MVLAVMAIFSMSTLVFGRIMQGDDCKISRDTPIFTERDQNRGIYPFPSEAKQQSLRVTGKGRKGINIK